MILVDFLGNNNIFFQGFLSQIFVKFVTMRSTIGVAELNDPVRKGKGWDLTNFHPLDELYG